MSGETTPAPERPNTICPACVLEDPRIRLCPVHAPTPAPEVAPCERCGSVNVHIVRELFDPSRPCVLLVRRGELGRGDR